MYPQNRIAGQVIFHPSNDSSVVRYPQSSAWILLVDLQGLLMVIVGSRSSNPFLNVREALVTSGFFLGFKVMVTLSQIVLQSLQLGENAIVFGTGLLHIMISIAQMSVSPADVDIFVVITDDIHCDRSRHCAHESHLTYECLLRFHVL